MKKIFTLIATALLTMGAYAQSTDVIELSGETLDLEKSVNPNFIFNGTDITIEMVRDPKVVENHGWKKGINIKNNGVGTIKLPAGVKLYGIEIYGFSQGDNWEYLLGWGAGDQKANDAFFEWVDPIGAGVMDNEEIKSKAKYPMDPCFFKSEEETVEYTNKLVMAEKFLDEPYEGAFNFTFSGNNQCDAMFVLYLSKEAAEKLGTGATEDNEGHNEGRTVIWEGEQTMDSSWPGVSIKTSHFATAKAGDAIIVTISKADNAINTDWQWGPQVFIKLDWADFFTAKSVDNGATNAEIKFEITAEDLEKIKAGSEIEIQGMNVVVVKAEIESATPTTSTAAWEGECAFGNWENGFSIEAEKFAAANEGDILEFVYTIDAANPNNWFQFKTIYGGTEGNYPDDCLTSNASELNDWGCATVASAYSEGTKSYKIVLNAADIAKLKETGLYTNGYYLNVSQVNLIQAGEPTAVQAVKTVKTADAIYNLAGQKVDGSYKGIVIKNGKKFVVK